MTESKVTLSIKTLNEVLAYLGTRPFAEVFQLINKVSQEVGQNEKSEDPKAEVIHE